jgi:hypothetical protein
LPSRSAEERAATVFESAYASASEYLPFDTDPGTLGVEQSGIVVLYAEVNPSGSLYLGRADFPVTIAEGLSEARSWSVQRPSIRTIFPTPEQTLPFVYCHSPERLASVGVLPPSDDNKLANSIIDLSLFGGIVRPSPNVGGRLTCDRITSAGARMIGSTMANSCQDPSTLLNRGRRP